MARTLSITTADRTSLLNGNLTNFLKGAENVGISVALVLRQVDSREIDSLKGFSCIVKLFFSENAPASVIRNFALTNLGVQFLDSYDFIAFLDDDCIPTMGLRNLKHISMDSLIAIGAYGPSAETLASRFQTDNKATLGYEYLINRSTNCTMYFRPSILKKLGPFYEGIGAGIKIFKTGEDTDMCHRYLKLGASFEIDNSILVIHPYKQLARMESISGDLLVSLSHLIFKRKSLFKSSKTILRFVLIRIANLNDPNLPNFSTIVTEVRNMRIFLEQHFNPQ